jgi:hypothetical protein
MAVSASRILRISFAWIAISDAWPDAPPDGSAPLFRVYKVKCRGSHTVDHDARVGEAVALALFAG